MSKETLNLDKYNPANITRGWEKAPKEVTCTIENCKRKIPVGSWVVRLQWPNMFWCKECVKMKIHNSEKELWQAVGIESPYKIEALTEDMNPFETLSNKDKAIAISKRFSLNREIVDKWPPEKLLEVWRTGKVDGDAVPVSDTKLEGVSEKRVIEIIDKKTPSIVQLARDSMAPSLQELKELINSKKELHLTFDELPTINMGKQHFKFEDVMKLVVLKMNVWMGGPAGAGKTYLASEIARALEKKFLRISCGPQTSASQIFGHTTAHGGYAPGIAYQAIKSDGKGAILLFDEFDRLNPAVAVMVNGLLDGNMVTFPNGETLRLGENGCIALVAANTFGKPTAEFGTAQRQDIATMSRFVKILIPVDEKLEMNLFGPINEEWVKFVQKVRKVVSTLGVTSLVVTPRASEYGVKLLASGMSRKNVEDFLLWNGVPSEDIKKIKQNLGA